MQERSIDGALLALRKYTIREGREGLDHVEAILAMRGVDMPRVLPAKRKNVARCGHMTLWVKQALEAGPRPLRDVVAYIALKRPEISAEQAYGCTIRVLVKMKAKGAVTRTGKLWRVT